MTLRSINGTCYASTHSDLVDVPLLKLFTLVDKGERFVVRLDKVNCSFTMDVKGVKKLTGGVEKFGVLNRRFLGVGNSIRVPV